MDEPQLSRRTVLKSASLLAGGTWTSTRNTGHGSSSVLGAENEQADATPSDRRAAMAIGYDVDMPAGGDAHLYEREVPWLLDDKGRDAHGHLNADIRDYIERLATIAERHDVQLHFFVQGNTFEKSDDLAFWKKFAGRGHAIDSHNYNHDSLLGQEPDVVRRQLKRTEDLIDKHLGRSGIGLRGPGGYPQGLRGRPDLQQAVLATGIEWVSCQFERGPHGDDTGWAEMIVDQQPYRYESGLLEIPFCGHQDRSFFDADMRGDPTRPVDDWINYLKQCVDIARQHRLLFALTVHPSTSFKHDPQGRYLGEILAYCRRRGDIDMVTYNEVYRRFQRRESGGCKRW